jgi:hypothetical protein
VGDSNTGHTTARNHGECGPDENPPATKLRQALASIASATALLLSTATLPASTFVLPAHIRTLCHSAQIECAGEHSTQRPLILARTALPFRTLRETTMDGRAMSSPCQIRSATSPPCTSNNSAARAAAGCP